MGLFTTTKEWDEALEEWEGIKSKPSKKNRKKRNGIKVFENDFVEKYLATSHWIGPGIWFIPLISYLIWYTVTKNGITGWKLGATLFIGVLGWTLVEYLLHRFFFHLQPGKSKFRRNLLFMAHGYHHEFPNDPGRLVAPPALAWPLGLAIGVFCWLTMGVYWHAIFAGICIGYLGYDWMHYYSHHGRPITKTGKFLRRFHLEHHFKNETVQFGLSSPFWDVILGTFRAPDEKMTTSAEEAFDNAVADEPATPPTAQPIHDAAE